jgi:hypothetical protein
MSKNDRIATFVASLPQPDKIDLHPCYTGYFTCFNSGQFYEAHDVLEHLWLKCSDKNYLFYKGLIQIAGAFVHLQKHYARPEHPTDGRRLHPAVRLFALGIKNISLFAPVHMSLDILALCAMCSEWKSSIELSDFLKNPLLPGAGPRIDLISPS